MKKSVLLIILAIIISGCIILPRKQTSINEFDLYKSNSLIENNMINSNQEYLIVNRYISKNNNNFYYIIIESNGFHLIRLNNRGLYCYYISFLNSFRYLSENFNTVLTDSMLNLSNKISDDPYIELSGKINGIDFSQEIFYRKIIGGTALQKYVNLLEQDLLNVLEQGPNIYQYHNNKQLNIENFIHQCGNVR